MSIWCTYMMLWWYVMLWDVLLLFVALGILVVATWHCSRHSHKNVVGGDVPV